MSYTEDKAGVKQYLANDRERKLDTSSHIFPTKTMRVHNIEIDNTSVNGNLMGLPPVVTLCQTRHEDQVAFDRHPVTLSNLGNIKSHLKL